MRSLSDLNGYSTQTFDVVDTRTSKVIFSVDEFEEIRDYVFDYQVHQTQINISQNVDIIEVINYQTAQAYMKIKVNALPSISITDNTLSFPNKLPSLSVTRNNDTFIVAQINSVEAWDSIKNFIWNVPIDMYTRQSFYLDISVGYFDSALNEIVERTWHTYDLDYYYTMREESIFSMNILSSKAKFTSSTINESHDFDLNLGNVTPIKSSIPSIITLDVHLEDEDIMHVNDINSSHGISCILEYSTRAMTIDLLSIHYCDNIINYITPFSSNIDSTETVIVDVLDYDITSCTINSIADLTITLSIVKTFKMSLTYASSTGNKYICLNITGTNYTVNWGDGNSNTYTATSQSLNPPQHFYASSAGTRIITITGGSITYFVYNGTYTNGADTQTLPTAINLSSWGDYNMQTIGIRNCGSYVATLSLPSFVPSTTTTIDFSGCYNLGRYDTNFTLWDTSNITSMTSMFNGCIYFNQNISSWNVQNVTNFSYMFYSGSYNYFNQDISTWWTKSATNMNYMFYNASTFNKNLSSWDVHLIPTLPTGFSVGATVWTLPRPVWGTYGSH